LSGFERVTGSSFNDTLTGDDGDNFVEGQDGNDSVFGGGGNDTMEGRNDDDIVSGGAGNDGIDGGTGNDILTGGADADTFAFFLTEDTGADQITDFSRSEDALWFLDVLDSNGDSTLDLADLDAAIASFTNEASAMM
jgi:Ca2+-binding RTX toxin-like protein